MKIIDFNKKNKRLICEIGEEEYKRIIVALYRVYPPIFVAHTTFNKDELEGRINELENGRLIPVDDEIKPKLNKDTLGELNNTILSVDKYLNIINKLPDKAVMATMERRDLTSLLQRTLNALNQIKKEVA